jgi:hypothetical protein
MFITHYFEYVGDCEVTVIKSPFVAFCVGDGRKCYFTYKLGKNGSDLT